MIQISDKLGQKLVNYLQTKPYGEVNLLIAELFQAANPQVKQEEKVESASKKRS